MSLNDHPQVVAALILELALVFGMSGVAVALHRLRVNGPCQLCLLLLLTWRATVVATGFGRRLDEDYFGGLLFASVFLYAIHHLAGLIHDLRRWRWKDGASRMVGRTAEGGE